MSSGTGLGVGVVILEVVERPVLGVLDVEDSAFGIGKCFVKRLWRSGVCVSIPLTITVD